MMQQSYPQAFISGKDKGEKGHCGETFHMTDVTHCGCLPNVSIFLTFTTATLLFDSSRFQYLDYT